VRENDTIQPLGSEDLWGSLYDDVLTPSFPPAELDDRDTFLDQLRSGVLRARGVVEEGRVVAGVMTLSFPRSSGPDTPGSVTLVLYLAIAPGRRGGGIGGALLDDAVHDALESGADVVLVEVEHPDHHEASEEHGDPVARLRFYARHGVRLLAVPYFQPALGPGRERVPALLLGTLGLSGTGVGSRRGSGEPSSVRAAPVREFLRRYLAWCEGAVADDAAVRRLLKSVSGTEVALATPDELDRVPVATLTGSTRRAPAPEPGPGEETADDA